MNRRDLIGVAGAVAGVPSCLSGAAGSVAIVADPADPLANSTKVRWAAAYLEKVLAGHGIRVIRSSRVQDSKGADTCIVIGGTHTEDARQILASAGVRVGSKPESLALVPGQAQGRNVVLASGSDDRGLVYALLELADRAKYGSALRVAPPILEQPANSVRSNTRLFCSDVEDKPWFTDREMWPQYLTMLASQRFNRFNLSFGIGYDFLRQVTDAYFLFLYPFLLDVPGYKVRVTGLPDAERDRNLAMLKSIAAQTVERGMDFQLGIWTHGYQWIDSPRPNYTIEGLSAANHAAYSRDAVCALLKEIPHISGVTFRVHGESGVEEGSYDFWKTVFDGVVKSGRKVEIDMHAKGMDDTMLQIATATGLPVKVSPKYWAEHMGMPYHQADIRQQEIPRQDRQASGLMKFSAGSRSFLRYGYGDLLREDRKWGILHRIWPGTQRVLLWGDPLTAAAHSKAFTFCGSDGVEIMEPLSFKGRRGSGIAGDRCAYADSSLRPRWDWQKYEYGHRVWGRHLYNPDSSPDGWRRYLTRHFGAKASAAETALANASRILPIITTAHGASAANNTYWPEVYTNQPIVNPDRPHPYRDTPAPRSFGNVSPFDPQIFSRVSDFAKELVNGERSGKYSPVEVARWLDEYAGTAAKHLASVRDLKTREQRRLVEDVALQSGIGRFFAAKLRAAVLYSVFQETADRAALEQAVVHYGKARDIWAEFANRARGVYTPDITIGERRELRGHWLDRLPEIDADLGDMKKKLEQVSGGAPNERARAAIREVAEAQARNVSQARHTPPPAFHPGQPLDLEISIGKAARQVSARMFYRHVTQAERFQSVNMQAADNRFRATISGQYTDSAYPLEYYFELREAPDHAWLYPGFNAELTTQPYFVLRRA
jgi:hypothetical protein